MKYQAMGKRGVEEYLDRQRNKPGGDIVDDHLDYLKHHEGKEFDRDTQQLKLQSFRDYALGGKDKVKSVWFEAGETTCGLRGRQS
eukprot:1314641-Amorphochlora_amoeboformis.AAC.1